MRHSLQKCMYHNFIIHNIFRVTSSLIICLFPLHVDVDFLDVFIPLWLTRKRYCNFFFKISRSKRLVFCIFWKKKKQHDHDLEIQVFNITNDYILNLLIIKPPYFINLRFTLDISIPNQIVLFLVKELHEINTN